MSISDKIIKLNQVKQDIKQAIEDKGVGMSGVPFANYPLKISEISGGGSAAPQGSIFFTDDLELAQRAKEAFTMPDEINNLINVWEDYKRTPELKYNLGLTLVAAGVDMGGAAVDIYSGNHALTQLYNDCANGIVEGMYNINFPGLNPGESVSAVKEYIGDVRNYSDFENLGLEDFPFPIYSFMPGDDFYESLLFTFFITDLSFMDEGLGVSFIRVSFGKTMGDSITVRLYKQHKNYDQGLIADLNQIRYYNNNRYNAPLAIKPEYDSEYSYFHINGASFYNWQNNNHPLVIPDNVTRIGAVSGPKEEEAGAFRDWSSNNHPLVIPDGVTFLGVSSFSGWTSNKHPLNIPNSVTTLGDAAFSNWTANDQQLVIGNGVTDIRIGTFSNWTSNSRPLVIPGSVTYIGYGAFENWNNAPYAEIHAITPPSLDGGNFNGSYPIYVPDASLNAYKTTSSWSGWNNLASRIFPMSEGPIKTPDGTTHIDDYAYDGLIENNRPLVISSSVTNIGSYAFSNWTENNHQLVIPDSVTNIGNYAFTNWTANNYPLVIGNGVTEISYYGFSNWESNDHSLVIPDSVRTIENSAFRNWESNNKPLVIPDSVTSIGYYSFENWASNNYPLVIPNSVTYMGDYTFQGWTSNNHPLVIGNGIGTIRYASFSKWTANNHQLVIPNSVTSIGMYAFDNWTANNHPLVIPDSVTSIGSSAFYGWKANERPLVIPDSVTSIGSSAFRDWTANNHPLVIPDSVTSIDNYVFDRWTSNNQPLVIPNSVTSIGIWAFRDWTSNNQPLVIGNSVTSIGDYAFYNWRENKQPLVIPNSVTSIGEHAFREWRLNDQPLVIGNSVTSIGNYAFYGWNRAAYAEIHTTTPPTLGTDNFSGSYPIYVPDESVDDYKTATNWVSLADRIFPISHNYYFNYAKDYYAATNNLTLFENAWEHSLTVDPLEISASSSMSGPFRGSAQYPNGETEGVIIPQGVTVIGQLAFQYWPANNQPLVIPNSVTSIVAGAFSYWPANNHPLVIPSSVTSIGNNAFSNWNANTHPIVIPNSVTNIGEYSFGFWGLVPYVEMKGTTPPTLRDTNAFDGQNNAPIYVPDESVTAYKTATNWRAFASRIFSINDK